MIVEHQKCFIEQMESVLILLDVGGNGVSDMSRERSVIMTEYLRFCHPYDPALNVATCAFAKDFHLNELVILGQAIGVLDTIRPDNVSCKVSL